MFLNTWHAMIGFPLENPQALHGRFSTTGSDASDTDFLSFEEWVFAKRKGIKGVHFFYCDWVQGRASVRYATKGPEEEDGSSVLLIVTQSIVSESPPPLKKKLNLP